MEKQLYDIKLVANDQTSSMYNEIYSSLMSCKSFIFNVAFINFSGLQLLIKALDQLRTRQVKGKILTSDYLNFTDPRALRKLLEFDNIETKVFLQEQFGGFHTKAYIFEYEDDIKLYIGSSNITENALLRNVEWNVRIVSKRDFPIIDDVLNQFSLLWEKTQRVNEVFLSEYEQFVNDLLELKKNEEKFIYREVTVRPNKMQERAIQQLHRLRTRGEDRGLVIAATGTGKTYVSAFDVQQFSPNRVLFIAHREDILIKAEESFKKVLGSRIYTGRLSGTSKDIHAKYLFSTINSLNNYLETFDPNAFDYIIFDEAHHAVADSYIRVFEYFNPDFVLGMTATPERMDGYKLFSLFKNNVAIEVRLHEAIESGLVVPFHYFGITEAEGIDLSTIDENDIDTITKRLNVHHRVDYIVEKIKLYGHEGKKIKALGFCISLEHAQFMSNEFNRRGIRSQFISGFNTTQEKQDAMTSLESDLDGSAEVIFSVDIFNEGVDIPSINTILMLRPTNSPIIFIQQLGRGLRKSADKTFVTVLDFIGNYRKSFMIAIALKGSQFIDKDSLRVSLQNNFSDLPGTAFVQMDEIARKQILKQINHENFNKLKYLKDDYFTFKRQNNNKIPYFLMLYELYDGSPDPVKFIKKESTYLQFIKKVEDLSLLDIGNFSIIQNKALKQLSNYLPLRRPFEFIILDLLSKNNTITFSFLKQSINSYLDNVSDETIKHSISCLEGKYYDANEVKTNIIYILYDENTQSIHRSHELEALLDATFSPYYKDIINYGLTRFRREFANIIYSVPFFVFGKTYTLKNTSTLSNSLRKPGAFFGAGVIPYENSYFIFAELKKDINTRPSINYVNRILNINKMSWESPNMWNETTPSALNFIHHKKRNIHLYMFIRKFKNIDGVIQPFIYLGKVNYLTHSSNNPVQFEFEFEKTLPFEIFNELTTPTDLN